MLHKKGLRKLGFFLLVFVSIVGFGVLLVSRFNQTDITPAAKTVPGSPEAAQATPLQPTDKVELSQTDLIEVKPSETVTSAEQAMPAPTAPAYPTACQRLKSLYTTDHDSKVRSEDSRHGSAQQSIINKYSKEGRSFSSSQKLAQTLEAKRHDLILKQLGDQLQRQLRKLNC